MLRSHQTTGSPSYHALCQPPARQRPPPDRHKLRYKQILIAVWMISQRASLLLLTAPNRYMKCAYGFWRRNLIVCGQEREYWIPQFKTLRNLKYENNPTTGPTKEVKTGNSSVREQEKVAECEERAQLSQHVHKVQAEHCVHCQQGQAFNQECATHQTGG